MHCNQYKNLKLKKEQGNMLTTYGLSGSVFNKTSMGVKKHSQAWNIYEVNK